MEKIKLKDGTLFDIVPMGISQSDKVRKIKFISTLPYVEIEALFDNADNIENIQHLSESSETLATYLDCVNLKSLSKAKNVQINDSLTADLYTVELSIDAVEKALTISKTERRATDEAVLFLLTELMPMMMG